MTNMYDTGTRDRILRGGGSVVVGSAGGVTMTLAAAQGVTITGGTTTTNTNPLLSMTRTWNSGGVTFTAIKLVVTDTASAAASLLMDLQTGSGSQFKIDKNGIVTIAGAVVASSAQGINLPNGSPGNVALALGSGGNNGFFLLSANKIGVAANGSLQYRLGDDGLQLTQNALWLGWGTTAGTPEMQITRSATGSLTLTSIAVAAGAVPFTITHGADTAVTTEKSTLVLSAHTVAITGAIATFRDTVFNAATYNGAFTVSAAMTVDIAAPIAGTSTLTASAALRTAGSVVHGTGALATGAVNGFLYIPTCAGTPSGTPEAWTGTVPLIYDSTNNILYIYNAAWKRPKAVTGPVNVDWE